MTRSTAAHGFTRSDRAQQRDRVRGDRFAAADRVDAFVGLALDADARRRRCRARRRRPRASRRRRSRSFGRSSDRPSTSTLPTSKPCVARRSPPRAPADRGSTRPSSADRYRENAGRYRRGRRRRESRRSPRGRRRRRRNGRARRARTGSSRRRESAAGRRRADADRSRCRPHGRSRGRLRPLAGGDRFGHRQILRRRDLDVRRLAVDEPHRVPGPLGQRRFVGRIDAVRPSASASRSTSRRKACGVCARKIDSRASVSRDDQPAIGSGHPAPLEASAPLHRVARLNRRERRARFRRRGNRPRDQVARSTNGRAAS